MTFLNCSAYQLLITDWSTVIPLIRTSLSRHRHSADDLTRSNLHGSRPVWMRPSSRFPDPARSRCALPILVIQFVQHRRASDKADGPTWDRTCRTGYTPRCTSDGKIDTQLMQRGRHTMNNAFHQALLKAQAAVASSYDSTTSVYFSKNKNRLEKLRIFWY